MKTTYTVFGNKKQGYRIAVPTKAKMADEYACYLFKDMTIDIPLPEGTLVYVPKVEP